MVKEAKKHASGGQGQGPYTPTCVTARDRGSLTVTIKTGLATFPKGWLPAALPEAILPPSSSHHGGSKSRHTPYG